MAQQTLHLNHIHSGKPTLFFRKKMSSFFSKQWSVQFLGEGREEEKRKIELGVSKRVNFTSPKKKKRKEGNNVYP